MSKALRNSRDFFDREPRNAARRSGREPEAWLDDEIGDEDARDSMESEDRLDAVTRRLARVGESRRAPRETRRWRDEAREEFERDDRVARRRARSRDERAPAERPYDDAERLDARAIVDDAAAIVERRLAKSERNTQQALAHLAGLIKRSQQQGGDSEAVKRAIAAFAERADQSDRQTARALNDIAGLLEQEQRGRGDADSGFVALAERLARIENRLTEPPAAGAVRPIRSALARLETRLDRLSQDDRTADFEHALSGLDKRLAEIARRLDQDAQERDDREAKLREHQAETRPATPTVSLNGVSAPALEQGLRRAPATTRRPLVDAIAEITQRQRVLEEAYAAPPAPEDNAARARFDTLQTTIESISRQLDGVREDASERADQQLVAMRQMESLRRELQDMAVAVSELAPRASVAAVENALRDLAHRVETQRDRGVADELLAPAERIAGELRAVIKDLDPSAIVHSLRADVLSIGRRLDAMQTQSQSPSSVDGEALRILTKQTHEIREQLSLLASRPLPLEKIETRLFDLTQRVDQLSLSAGGSATDMGELVKAIRSIVSTETTRGFETFNTRLEQLSHKFDEAASRSGAKRFDELGARIDELGRSLAKRIDTTAQKGADTAPLEQLVAKLAKKIDSALDQKPHGAGFEEIGRKIEQLETRIGESAPTESFKRIEAMLKKPVSDQQFADLAQRIDLVQKTLAARVGQGAGAAEPGDVRFIEELVRSLDQKIEAAVGGEARQPDLQAVERQLSQLSFKIDRLEDPSANPRLGALLARPVNNPQLDEIADRLERMQAALTQRAEEGARVDARHSDLAALVEKLATRVNQALDPHADTQSLRALETQISALSKRLDSTGHNGDALIGIEKRIGELVARIEDTRSETTQAAEAAVRRATQEILREAAASGAGVLPGEVERELTDIRKTQDESGQRTHETLLAVHETLERVVDRLALFEDELSEIRAVPTAGAPRGAAAAPTRPEADAPLASPRAPAPRELRIETAQDEDLMDFLLPPGGPAPRREPTLSVEGARKSAAESEADDAGRPSVQSDFIAAARRAAQQAARDAEAAEVAQQSRRGAARVAGAARAAKVAMRAEDAPAAGAIGKVGAVIEERKKPLLLGLAAVVLLVGAYSIARVSLDGAGAPTQPATLTQEQPADPAAPTSAPTAEAPAKQTVAPPPVEAESAPVAKPAPPPLPRLIPPPAAKPGKSTTLEGEGVDTSPTGAIAAAPLGAQDSLPAVKALASKGDAAAQYEFAARLVEGRGVTRDPKAAAQWFEKAAEQGLAPAQYRVGSMYEKGVGVDRSYAQARKWYELAADAGNARAMHNLAVLLAEGGDGKPDYAAASEWFKKAADHGVRDSQYNLAILYARGLGVGQSLTQSYLWFSAAADQGDDDARKKRDEVGARLDSKELANAKALVSSFKPKQTVREANDVLPPPGGWESLKDAAPHPAAKPAGKAKVSQI